MRFLAPLFLDLVAEQDEIERLEGLFQEAGDDAEKAAKIEPSVDSIPSLFLVDGLALSLGEDPSLPRRLAGYLSRAAQPGLDSQDEKELQGMLDGVIA